jgi:hypothetical protein
LRALSLLYNGLPTYSNNDLHILIKNIILINLFILFHPSTGNSPVEDSNLGLLTKPADHSFYRFGCHRRKPVIKYVCSVSMDATQLFILNVLLPYWLDLKIFRDDANKIQTNIYRKPTERNTVLHFNGNHPQHLKTKIPTGQFLRQSCSTLKKFDAQAKDMTHRFAT